MTLQQYITKINILYKTGNAREHSYRGDLQNLIMAILPDVLVTNEPARVVCGAPDYVLTKKDIPLGYIEAKDIGVDLASKTLKEQFDRYKAGLTNLIFTDYLDFHFYKEGIFVIKIAIARVENGTIISIPENFDQFTNLIVNFAQTISQTIKSPTKLAQMMAGKAKLMADVIEKSLNNDDENGIRSSIKSQMLSFQQMLIHDIDNKSFADIYSQTIAYGMFAARYHDPTLPTFSREEAATLIPKSNPFLRKLFQDIAGYDLDNRLVWIVEELVSIFLASDVAEIMKNFGKSTKQEDPVVHFYETFLGEYNPALRKARGVWYTPQPVVNFIVRAVDDILKTEFGLKDGLADTSKIKIKKKAITQTTGKDAKLKEVETEIEVHKVQILDPATGTGTFLAEVVRHIHKKFEGQQGIWSKYVTNDLIPRLNGFELLMASYAMAHLKMDMLLTETGYKPTNDQRFRIFLTNSLEEAHPDTQTLFSSWLSDEADQANAIKRDAPVMVVMGNPPYSVSSSNKSEWIQNLIKEYKKDLNERKINLDDDYIKFTRFGQHFIDKNGSGILAYISNNSFIDGITHRQMRKNLLESFDKIYILDLHGNAKKKEVCLDGSPDQNVFDIMQGVSINIFVKTGNKKKEELGEVFHYDLQGKRDFKYKFLEENISKLNWNKLNFEKPYYFFVPKDFGEQIDYEKGFKVDELFKENVAGIETIRDAITIHFDENSLKNVVKDFIELDENEIAKKYDTTDARDWKIGRAKDDLKNNINNSKVWQNVSYRPFDIRKTFYSGKQNGFVCNGRFNVMKHLLNNNNCLIIPRQTSQNWRHCFITNQIFEGNITASAKLFGTGNGFPLYLYPETTTQKSLLEETARTPNLNMEIVNEFSKKLGIPFVAEKETFANETFGNDTFAKVSNFGKGETKSNKIEADFGKVETKSNKIEADFSKVDFQENFAPIDILDYIYAVLHSPSYREKYKEFLKIDFPRVPFPDAVGTSRDLSVHNPDIVNSNRELSFQDIQDKFWKLVKLGSELRQIHLLESEVVEKRITQFDIDGTNVVSKPKFVNSPPLEECPKDEVEKNNKLIGNVYINETQYFANVPEVAWNFYIGGYQPAQKWLKDRKGRELTTEDIFHYQKIIVALTETDRIMKDVDLIEL
ncbi:type ISP restriction/modification enzyme [Flavobacterium sp.]|uniref:type ISP restriction/modification enzyme n=1 Tax=Flavobacterium sp. TaxID=239 RepID=UPI00374FEA3F